MSALTPSTPNQIAFLADTKTHRFRFDIPSSDGTKAYRVSQATATSQWQCGCPAWIYQKGPMVDRKPCKHLRAMTDLLLQIEGSPAAAASLGAAPAKVTAAPAAQAPARQIASGRAAAVGAIEALVTQAETEVAAARQRLADAEAKLAALKAAAKAA